MFTWIWLVTAFVFMLTCSTAAEEDLPNTNFHSKKNSTRLRFRRPYILFRKRGKRSTNNLQSDSDSDSDSSEGWRGNDKTTIKSTQQKSTQKKSTQQKSSRLMRRDISAVHPCIDLGWVMKKLEADERKREQWNIDVLKKLKGLWVLAAKENRKVKGVQIVKKETPAYDLEEEKENVLVDSLEKKKGEEKQENRLRTLLQWLHNRDVGDEITRQNESSTGSLSSGDAAHAIKDRTEVSKNATAPSTQENNIDEKDNRSKNTAELVGEATTVDDDDGHKVAEATTVDDEDGQKGDITFLSAWNMETLKQRVEVFVDRFVDQLMDEKRKKKNILSKPKRTQSKRKVDELQDKVKEEMSRLDNHQAKKTSRKITDEKLEQIIDLMLKVLE